MGSDDWFSNRWRRRHGRRSIVGPVLGTLVLGPAAAAAAAVGVGVATASAAQAHSSGCVISGLVTTCTYTFSGGGVDAWEVPTGVEKATFTVIGASGGSAAGRPGGRGGGVIATLDVTPGHVYGVVVGGRGGSDTDEPGFQGKGGWNGGGNGAGPSNPGGGGGGGASEIQLEYAAGPRILVGGGGGGAGSNVDGGYPRGIPGAGGDGGGTGNGNQGSNVSGAWVGAGGGGGGSATAAGFGGGQSGGTLPNGCGTADAAMATQGDAGYADSYGRQFGGSGGSLVSVWNANRRCDQYRGWGGGGGGGGWRAGGGGGGGITGGAGGGGGSGYAPPGSASTQGQLGAHGLITISYLDPADPWASQSGGPMTSAPTAVARPQTGHLFPIQDVFYLNGVGQVIQRVVTEGVPSPEYNLGKTMYPGSTIAAIWRPGAGGRLDIFGRGTDNALWQRSFSWQFGWKDWRKVPSDIQMTSSPTVVSPDGTRLDVFYRGSDNRLKQVASTDGNWAEQPTTVPGGPAVTTAPGATDTAPGRVDLLAGCNGALCWWTSTNGTWAYRGTVPATNITSTPAVSSPREGWIEVVARDQNNAMAQLGYVAGGDWFTSTAPVPSPAGSALTRVTGPNAVSITYARGLDDRLTAKVLGPG